MSKKPLHPLNLENNIKRAASHFSIIILQASKHYVSNAFRTSHSLQRAGFDSEETIDEIAFSLEDITRRNYEEIAHGAIQKVKNYVNLFDVKEKGYDYYKCAYFYAFECLFCLRKEKSSYRILASIALIYMMDDILDVDLSRKLHKNMRVKLLNSVSYISTNSNSNDAYPWFGLYGKYGVYMIFKNVLKCCSVCEDKSL